MRRSLKILIGTIIVMLLIMGVNANAVKSEPNNKKAIAISFKDKNVEKAIRAALKKPKGSITSNEVLGIIELSLANSGIKSLDDFVWLKGLKKLDISNDESVLNRFKNLDGLSTLDRLEELDVSHCELKDISPISRLKNLKVLKICGNELNSIVPLRQLKKLTDLETTAGDREYDMDTIAALTSLQHLYIANDKIKTLGKLKNLINLKELEIPQSNISDIRGIEKLKNLEELALSGNQISDIEPLSYLKNLSYLYLEDNKINNVGPLKELNNMEVLDLSFNDIIDIEDLSNLHNLKDLRLGHNGINNIEALNGLEKLESIDLSENFIRDVEPIMELENLTYLNLSTNLITDILPLTNLIGLESLYLHGNKITDYNILKSYLTKLKNKDFLFTNLDIPYVVDIAYGNNTYAVIGRQGEIMTSKDCINWQINWKYKSMDSKEEFSSIIWGNNEFLAVGNGSVLKSNNGDIWTKYSTPNIPKDFKGREVWDGNKYVLVGSNLILTSTDGTNWVKQDYHDDINLKDIIFKDNKYFAVGGKNSTGRIVESKDGITWTSIGRIVTKYSGDSFKRIKYTNNRFQIISELGSVYNSEDGETWFRDDNMFIINSIVSGGDMQVGIQDIGDVNGMPNPRLFYSKDGKLWNEVSDVLKGTCIEVKWLNNQFIIESYLGDSLQAYTSVDGVKWNTVDIK